MDKFLMPKIASNTDSQNTKSKTPSVHTKTPHISSLTTIASSIFSTTKDTLKNVIEALRTPTQGNSATAGPSGAPPVTQTLPKSSKSP